MFDGILVPYFADRGDVLVSGEGYLRHDASNDSEQLAPDCMVAFGVDNPDEIEARPEQLPTRLFTPSACKRRRQSVPGRCYSSA